MLSVDSIELDCMIVSAPECKTDLCAGEYSHSALVAN